MLVYYDGHHYVRAFEARGNRRPFHLIAEGDKIDWKRQGSRGFKTALVTACHAPMQQLQIQPINAAGHHAGRRRWIGARAVMVVYEKPNSAQRRSEIDGAIAIELDATMERAR